MDIELPSPKFVDNFTFDVAWSEDQVRALVAAERARADAAERDARRYQLALEDCRLLAARWRNHPGWVHILRFCEAVGVTGSPLRGAATEGVQHGEAE